MQRPVALAALQANWQAIDMEMKSSKSPWSPAKQSSASGKNTLTARVLVQVQVQHPAVVLLSQDRPHGSNAI